MNKWMKRIILLPIIIVVLFVAVCFLFPGLTYHLATEAERAKSGLKENSIDVNGLTISYLTGGQGQPLLLLHGFACSKDHWVRVSRTLGQYYRIIAPDLPGCGESSKDIDLNYSIEKQAERIYAFTQAIGLNSFHVGGNSMGGAIASVLAARYPDRILSIWLLAPGGVKTPQPSEREQLLDRGINMLVPKTMEDFDRTYRMGFEKPPNIPNFLKKYLAKKMAESSDLLEKIYQDVVTHPIPTESSLANLPTPTLILWGDHDRFVHVSGAAVLDSLMPNARTIVMKNIGHVPMLEDPELTAKYYLEFQKKR